jgi:hypothetical protein
MAAAQVPSEFRIDKQRVDAIVTLSSGDSTRGCFFTAGGSRSHDGPERVGDLLNGASGFFPFEVGDRADTRTVLYNRAHVVMVTLRDHEAQHDPGYAVATRRFVSILFSNGQRLFGSVRVRLPEGRDRLSDWARQSETFRYVETGDATVLINVAHIVDVSEVPEP